MTNSSRFFYERLGWLAGCEGCCLGSLRVPFPEVVKLSQLAYGASPWLGPERRPKTQRTGLFLIALGWGYGEVDYKCSGSVFPEHLGNETQTIGLF